MNFNFPAILVFATFVTGVIWLFDVLLFAPRRKALVIAQTAKAEGGGDASPLPDPILVEYARSFFPVILLVLLLRSFLVEPFRIPSGSMMPTLLVGDFILVNKFAYGIRLPVLNKKVIEVASPSLGDVVVFRYPREPSIDYIKRVVGVPGDQIAYRQKTVYINGRPAIQVPVGIYNGMGSGAGQTGSLRNIETLNGLEHDVLINPQVPDFPPGCQFLRRGPITVPAGHYFVMGDNRDNSHDSRCWGLVPDENLVGNAFAIWMSWDSARSGSPIAWERLGITID